ncbi:hypothetical protein B4135_3895 [Caldibacillus debilis]|uniref:Uncharacterized protein n=1 Tax=Caldibacillus debilis TaxID=301148 RepID=A0A150L9L1_9BACI|nr:hypothetical protein B4135_3895 [Caldibacillus debilis]
MQLPHFYFLFRIGKISDVSSEKNCQWFGNRCTRRNLSKKVRFFSENDHILRLPGK